MLSWFQRIGLLRKQVRHSFFHPADEFRKILYHEQLRSDRSGNIFSLVTFQIHEKSDVDRQLGLLEKVLTPRLRATDLAGMLDSCKVGVVLPYTLAATAWGLVDDLSIEDSTRVIRLSCEVFEYPSKPLLVDAEEFEASSWPVEELSNRTHQPLWMRAISWCGHLFDITGAVVGLVVTSPLMLTAALAIKLASPGPVLFRQRREGRFGKPFTIYKFRTMYAGAEAMQVALREHSEQDGPAFKMSDDPRVTLIGRILRSTSIDELPQFFNVLRRDMSLVGPRPLPIEESVSCDVWQRRRLTVRPGLTCIWQIHGRSTVSFDEWMRMDLKYIQSRSFLMDLKLLLKTVPAVVYRRGAK